VACKELIVMAMRKPFKAANGDCFALDLYFQFLKNDYFYVCILVIFVVVFICLWLI
jgi:hypothetical protein